MLNARELISAVKKAAVEAVEASQPADFCFGKVTSASPLRIFVEQRMTLGGNQLVLTETLSKTSPLEVGDQVVLLKKKGGQMYLVLDKVVSE